MAVFILIKFNLRNKNENENENYILNKKKWFTLKYSWLREISISMLVEGSITSIFASPLIGGFL